MSKGRGALIWIRTGVSIANAPITGANLYHALATEFADGRARAVCGRVLVGGYSSIETGRGRWPRAASCSRCIAIVQPTRHQVLDSEGDDYTPDSIADIAAEHGVTEAQLRQALRESHPDAGAAEVILAAREVER